LHDYTVQFECSVYTLTFHKKISF